MTRFLEGEDTLPTLSSGLQTTLIGMGTVFLLLGALSIIVGLLGRIATSTGARAGRRQNGVEAGGNGGFRFIRRPVPDPFAADGETVATRHERRISPRLAAAIGAAMAVCLDQAPVKYSIVDIRPLGTAEAGSAWHLVGRGEQINRRLRMLERKESRR